MKRPAAPARELLNFCIHRRGNIWTNTQAGNTEARNQKPPKYFFLNGRRVKWEKIKTLGTSQSVGKMDSGSNSGSSNNNNNNNNSTFQSRILKFTAMERK